MGEVLKALRLDGVAMVVMRLGKDAFQCVHLREVRNGRTRVGVRKPDSVTYPKARMTVHTHAECTGQHFLSNNIANGLTFTLHWRTCSTAIPGKSRAEALPTHEKRNRLGSIYGCVAHQIHTVRVGPRAHVHATRIHQRHKNKTDRFQLPVQCTVPGKTHDQAVQVGGNHFGSDAL